jgi:hypothetical protein
MTVNKLEREIQEPAWPLVLALGKALGVDCMAFLVRTAAKKKRPVDPGRRAKRP